MASGLHATQQAEDLGHKLLEAFRVPFELDRVRCDVGLTIGYALAPLDGVDPKVLLKLADAGMYVGKQEGKHCLRRFDWAGADMPKMPEPSAWVETNAPLTQQTAGS